MTSNRTALVTLLGLVLVTVACGSGEHASRSAAEAISPEQAVNELVVKWDNALRTGEVEGAVAIYVADNPAVMPPDQPGHAGQQGLATFFEGMFASGGVNVVNREDGVLSSGDLVIARGAYTVTRTDEAGEDWDETGKWINVSRRNEDGSLSTVRNIWNRDRPPAGADAPPAVSATGPAAAEDAACLGSPAAVDAAFVENWTEGNVPVLLANHTEQGSRMPPGMPSVDGRDELGAYLQGYLELFTDRQLELTETGEQVEGDLGYTWGRYSLSYTSDGGETFERVGKYLAVSTMDDEGCWRNQWVLWNSDMPWPGASS